MLNHDVKDQNSTRIDDVARTILTHTLHVRAHVPEGAYVQS